MERFLEVAVDMTAGSMVLGPDRVKHPSTDKLILLNGIFYELDTTAHIFLCIDVWEQCYNAYFKALKSNSRFLDQASGQCRHEMAVNVAHVTAFYREARAQPATHLPRFYRFLNKSRYREGREVMTADARKKLVLMGADYLKEAQRVHVEWNGTRWTEPRFLLGVLTDDARRAPFAAALLDGLGHGAALDVALTAAASSHVPAQARPTARPTPGDPAGVVLHEHLARQLADGSMHAELQLWALTTPAAVKELILLASSPPGPLHTFSRKLTPVLFEAYVPMLFVGFAHALFIESKVSVLDRILRAHPNAHPTVVQHLFMFGERGAWSRERRLASKMRCGRSAKSRAKAAEGKPLAAKPCSNRKQQLLTAKHAEASGMKYSTARIYKRGPRNLANMRALGRAVYDAKRTGLAAARTQVLWATRKLTHTKQARKQPPRASVAAKHLLPARLEHGTKVTGKRSSTFKNEAFLVAGRASIGEDAKELKQTAQRHAQKRPGNEHTRKCWQNQGEKRRLAEEAATRKATRTTAQPVRKGPQRTAGTMGRSKAAASASAEAMEVDASDSGDESDVSLGDFDDR